MNTLVWIAAPGGRAGHAGDAAAGLRLRVAVIPRLDAGTPEAAGMAAWPPAFGRGAVVAEFAAGPGAAPAATLPLQLTSAPNPALWAQFFPAARPVRASGADAPDARTLRVRSASADAGAAERVYGDVARTPLGGDGDDAAAYTGAAATALAAHAIAGPDAPPPVARAAVPTSAGALDFHAAFALLREHPTVLTALGLVLEFAAADASAAPASGVVRVRWTDAPAGPLSIVSPWTRYALGSDRFVAGSTPDIDAGTLRLTGAAPAADGAAGGEWRVFTVDVDAAAGRLRDAAAASAAGDAVPLPALKTGGLTLARTTLATQLAARAAAAQAGPPTSDTVLDADHLLLGYRVDVQHGGGEWRSLMARTATYTVGANVPVAPPQTPEEGHLKYGAALDYGDGVLRTDDVVARWTGWSLSVPRPRFDGSGPAAPVEGGPLNGFTFAPAVAPGSLPKLRFGATYTMRLRAVDVAGGSLALCDPLADQHATPPVTYARYEPVGSPDVRLPSDVAVAALGPGDSVVDVTVRSTLRHTGGLTPAQFAAQEPRYAPYAEGATGPGATGRECFAPRAQLDLAERHGVFDQPGGNTWPVVRAALAGVRDDTGALPLLPDPAAGGVAGYLRVGADVAPMLRQSDWPTWQSDGSSDGPSDAPKRVTLAGGGADDDPHLVWVGDVLAVSLPAGRQATLELSSTVPEGWTDQFAVSAHAAVLQDAVTAAQTGRHPLLTPVRTLTLTHAVRQPLADPAGTFQPPARVAGQTNATLVPTLPLFGLHAPSTAKVTVTASWTEVADADARPVVDAPVSSVAIGPDAAAFGDPIVQEFGDTRHRRVTYQAVAVSRYRRYFHDDEPPERFLASGALGTVDVPSTARPPVPAVRAVFPAFRWNRQRATAGGVARVVHTRDCLLRVELGRPWFASGEGELLGVVLAARAPAAGVVGAIGTQVGRDPIWKTNDPARWPGVDLFGSGAAPPVTVALPEAGGEVTVVPYAPWFDAARGCWYADVALPGVAAASYAPLVRLALGRYQPFSLAGLELSPVVEADFVAVLPTRTLTVERTGDAVSVTLAGAGPDGVRPNTVEYVLERRPDAVDDASGPTALADDGLPGWRAVDGQSRVGPLGATVQLTGVGADGAYRVRVREVESVPPAVPAGAAPPATPDPAGLAGRVVFVDAVLVPPAP